MGWRSDSEMPRRGEGFTWSHARTQKISAGLAQLDPQTPVAMQ